MIILKTIDAVRAWNSGAREPGCGVGFVPTMGFLHEGHLSLMKRAKSENSYVVASIFVNPTQFGPNEDLTRYPKDFEGDCRKLESSGVDLLFYPDPQELYGEGFQTCVEVRDLQGPLCGASREGHFKGVATVVLKLLNIVCPSRAYFGQKDFQQLRVIQTMVRDLNVNVDVIGCPTVREPDGLAMSSRNSYLSESERKQAVCLYESMCLARQAYESGETLPTVLLAIIERRINQEPAAKIEYARLIDHGALNDVEVADHECLFALAVRIGSTRLIDNMTLGAQTS